MAYVAIVPTLSTNNDVVYSTQWDNTYAAYKVFDGSLSTFWSAGQNQLTNQYVGYHATTPAVCTRVGIVPRLRSGDAITMKNYKIQGSNDNNTWVDLYTDIMPNDQSLSGTWVYKDFTNTTAYAYYRLFVLDSYSSTSLTVFELQFYYDDTPTPPPPPDPGFDIVIQYTSSEKNKVDKDLTDIETIHGRLKDKTSIIDPVIIVMADLNDLIGANYMTVDAFGRSYFINNIVSVRTDLVEIHAHVDVLSSFAEEIRANRAIITRQKKKYNLYLNDGSFKIYQNPMVLTKAFPSGFTNQSFILAVAGG